jgi:hypothetical protein
MKTGADRHPETLQFADGKAAVIQAFAIRMGYIIGERGVTAAHDIETWRGALALETSKVSEAMKTARRTAKASTSKAARQKGKALLDRRRMEAEAGLRDIGRQLDAIGRLPEPEQRQHLDAMLRNFVLPRVHAHGEVPGTALAAPDWSAATGQLRKASSEPSALKLGEALERGRFETSVIAALPMADVSGRLGNHPVTAHAEITPNAADAAQGDGAAVVAAIAGRLADPKTGHGIRVAQAYEALMGLWLERRNADGGATVTLNELARRMGFAWDAERGLDAGASSTVREAVGVLQRLTLRAFNLPALKGNALPSKLEEQAFTLALIGPDDGSQERLTTTWTALRFHPNSYLRAATTQPGAFLMGVDPKLNRLHPQRERAEVLLGRWLERQWRQNMNREHCSVNRRIELVLTDGMGLLPEEARRPRAETLDRMTTVLDKLEELSTLAHWSGDAAFHEVMAEIDAIRAAGRYVTKPIWHRLLETSLTLEAGDGYRQHYAAHGLTYKGGAVDPLAQRFREFLQRTGRPQATVARELGISASTLSRWLAGSTKNITATARDRAETMLASEGQGLLPLG